MVTQITSAGLPLIAPALVLGYDTSSESSNRSRNVIGSRSPAITLGSESLRSGDLSLYFTTAALAWTARNTLATAAVFTLTSPEEPNINMKFVRAGGMKTALDSETLSQWVVTVGYQEVL